MSDPDRHDATDWPEPAAGGHDGPAASPGPTRGMMISFMALLVGVAILAFVAQRHRLAAPDRPVAEHTALTDAVAQAIEQDKLIYAEFTAAWCAACKAYERETLDTPEARAILAHVVTVSIDYDDHTEIAQRFGVQALPTGVILAVENGRAEKIDSHTGALSVAQLRHFIQRNLERTDRSRSESP